MSESYTLNGKPLEECTDKELHSEWEAGMFMDVQEGLSKAQADRMLALERELEKRPVPPETD